ncbi:retrovirus-related pol polyprotein from transposon TNT 1-94 [Tanacetum coccineum]
MDLCGPMCVASVNGKKYTLVIIDDYSQFTWVKFLASKDKAPDFIIEFLKMIQVRLNATVKNIRTDNGTEFLTEMASEQLGSGPGLQCMTPATPCSGLVPNPPPSAPFILPSRHEWDLVFQPVFDEFFSSPASVASAVPIEEASAPVESTGSPSSTTVDQDAPSPKIVFEESSSSDVISTTMHSDAPITEHLSKLTKDHSLQNIIGDPSRPISKRLQLYEQALFCYYDPLLTSVKPKTYKDALTQSCWIEAMQKELHEFKHLEVYELIPRPNKVMMDVKTAFLNGILRLQISHSPRGIFLNQSKYALESLKKYKLDEDTQGKAVDPTHYRGMVGTFMYLTSSRPDLGLWYSKDSSIALTAFADADHAGCQDTRQSTSGSMQLLGDKLVSWSSKRQKSVAISKQVENGVVELYFVRMEYQLADIFTNALCRERIEFLIDKLGMRSFTPETLKELADEAEV